MPGAGGSGAQAASSAPVSCRCRPGKQQYRTVEGLDRLRLRWVQPAHIRRRPHRALRQGDVIGRESIFLTIEYTSRTAMMAHIVARNFDDTAIRCQISFQYDKSAVRFNRFINRPDNFLSWRLYRGFRPRPDGRDAPACPGRTQHARERDRPWGSVTLPGSPSTSHSCAHATARTSRPGLSGP